MQTIAAHYWPRPDRNGRFPLERRLFQTEPGVQVLVESQRPEGAPKGEIVMVHGLEGSGEAGYMRSLSAAALGAGFAAHRFHMRTCGGTEHLCQTLYHAGLTSDLLAVLRQFRSEGRAPAFLVGFSLGGNVVLKLAGELGESARGTDARRVRRLDPLDLAALRAAHLAAGQPVLRAALRAQHAGAAAAPPAAIRGAISRDCARVEAIDDRITAPSFGFGNAANYYRTQSAIGYLERHSRARAADPGEGRYLRAVRCLSNRRRSRDNPRIELLATEHGGHLGFLGRGPERFWLDEDV